MISINPRTTFAFALVLSMAGNGVATWGHPLEFAIGLLFPVIAILAEENARQGKSKSKIDKLLMTVPLLAAVAWSALHLASLGPDNLMRWLIPAAVDALLLSSLRNIRSDADVPEVSREAAEEPSRDTVPEASPVHPETVPGHSEDAVPSMTRKPSPRRPKTAPKKPSRVVRDFNEDVVLVRAAAAAAGKERVGIQAVKKQLGVGDAYAKKVIDQAFGLITPA